jgi:hypothetical protein
MNLKAVNPYEQAVVDTGTPTELIELIGAKGEEIADAMLRLFNEFAPEFVPDQPRWPSPLRRFLMNLSHSRRELVSASQNLMNRIILDSRGSLQIVVVSIPDTDEIVAFPIHRARENGVR